MDIYLVRHGEVEAHYQDRFYGGLEVELSDLGRHQAELAGDFLADVSLQAIYCSPLHRAGFGAQEVARRQVDLIPTIVEDFREIDRGRWTGLLKSEVLRRWPSDLTSHRADLANWRDHGGESLGDLQARVWASFDRVLTLHQAGDQIAVVAHLFPIAAILAKSDARQLERWMDWNIPTGSVSRLSGAGKRLEPVWVGRVPNQG